MDLDKWQCHNCKIEFQPGDRCFQFFSTEFSADGLPIQVAHGCEGKKLINVPQLDDGWFALVYYCSDECVLEDFVKRCDDDEHKIHGTIMK